MRAAGSRSPVTRRASVQCSWRLRATALLAALGVIAIGSLATPPSASANPDDGLSETTEARYAVDGKGPVEVTVTVTLKNNKPDSGSYYYFWNSYGIAVPEAAEDVRATSRGDSLPVSLESSDDPTISYAGVSFSSLMYGQQREIVWTYTIPGDPIRSDSYTRVGPGYATFVVVASGDEGQVSIEVVTPTSMTFDSTWDGFTSSDDGDVRTHRATESQDEYGTYAYVSVRDPDQADTTDVTVGDTTLTLNSFPDDAEWSDFVTEQVTTGLPLLEETVGQPWPGGVDTIREDVSPEVLGYAWFDPGRGEIVVPEDLDAALLMHELSHAWLNDTTLQGRWLYEGLSEFVGQHVAEQTDGEQTTYPTPDRDDDVALALTAWKQVELTDGSDETEVYGYAASYAAMEALLGDLDDDALTAVISAAYEGESAYADGDDVESQRTDWQRFLDLVADAGVTDADDVYRTWVVDGSQADLLDAWAPARDSYAAIDDADGAWLPPLGLRTAMTEWAFDDAATVTAALGYEDAALATDAVASTAAAVQNAAAEVGMPEPASLQASYEDAVTTEDYADLATLLPQAVDVIGHVGEASQEAAADGNPLSDLGQLLLSVDASAADSRESLADGDLDAADAAAQQTIDRAGTAPWLGAAALVVVLALLVGVVLLIMAIRRRRPAPAVAAPAWSAAPAGVDAHAPLWPAQSQGAPGFGGQPMPGATQPAPYPWPPPEQAASSVQGDTATAPANWPPPSGFATPPAPPPSQPPTPTAVMPQGGLPPSSAWPARSDTAEVERREP